MSSRGGPQQGLRAEQLNSPYKRAPHRWVRRCRQRRGKGEETARIKVICAAAVELFRVKINVKMI